MNYARSTPAHVRSPLRFEPNLGQLGDAVRFVARQGAATLVATDASTTLALREAGETTVLQLRVAGARSVVPEASVPLAGVTNYYVGADRSRWREGVPGFGRLTYRGVRDGVDLVYHGEAGQLEYDFVVQPGARPQEIALEVEGAAGLSLGAQGDLVIRTAHGEWVQPKPRVYQVDPAGQTHDVATSYRIVGEHGIGFEVAQYDTTRDLVIDPELVYQTYLGGSDSELTFASGTTDALLAVDGAGAALLVTGSASTDFPTSADAPQTVFGGGEIDVTVTKLAADGTLRYSTYLGGSGNDLAQARAVDANDGFVIAGTTHSPNYPTTVGAMQLPAGSTQDAFVTKLGPTGALVYSTYVGGSDYDSGLAMALDSAGNAVLGGATRSSNFPVTAGAVQPVKGGLLQDAFVTKLAPDGSLLYSTYLGGDGEEATTMVAVDTNDDVVFAGYTDSSQFPTTPGAIQSTFAGGGVINHGDLFIAKLGAAGLVYSTYFGGTARDEVTALGLDPTGNAILAGRTASTDFPTSAGAFQATNGGGDDDAFVTKLTPAGALVYSTYFGGTAADRAIVLAATVTGAAYVTGATASPDFPLSHAFGTDGNAFLARFEADGTLAFASRTDNEQSLALGPDDTVFAADFTLRKVGPTGAVLAETELEAFAHHLARDGSGNTWTQGMVLCSSNDPIVGGTPFQRACAGGTFDAYAAKYADTPDVDAGAGSSSGGSTSSSGSEGGSSSGEPSSSSSSGHASSSSSSGGHASSSSSGHASSPDAGADAAGAPDEGGCGCRTVPASGHGGLVALGLALVAFRRRRVSPA